MTWWSRPPEDERQALVERLRAILPAPAGVGTEEIRLPTEADPLEAAEALRQAPGFVWLDGAGRLFTRPLVTLEASDGRLRVEGPGGTLEEPGRGFDLLEAALEAWRGPSGAMLAGYLSYDLAAELERLPALPPSEYGLPDLHLALYDAHWRCDGGIWTQIRTGAWRPVEAAEPPARPGVDRAVAAGPVESRPTADGFQAAVQRTVDRIFAGELFQTNLCRRLEAALPEDGIWPLYRRMRALNPAHFAAYVPLSGGRAVLSSSPELYLRVVEGQVWSSPIKGTRPTWEEAQLLTSEKDRAELAMIVDVVRNDLARVCEAGSVKVESHADLMRLPTLVHTVSTVTGRLRTDSGGVAGLLRASFPPASISGAPKIHAMEVALAEEQRRRGPCMGAVGWISMDGEAELSVAIRTAVAGRGRVAYETGCGITANSQAAQEVEETRHKAWAFLRALGREED